jgi:hypothetical protein
VNPDRFHLTLTSAGRPVMHGWWSDEAVARAKHRDWIGGEHGSLPAARITLVDEETGTLWTAWPDQV